MAVIARIKKSCEVRKRLLAIGMILIAPLIACATENTAHILSFSPDKVSRVYGDVELMSSEDQKLFVQNGIKKIDRVILKAPFRYPPQIIWHTSDCAEVVVGTGSPGRFSVFYDLRNNRLSGEIWFVVAYDEKRGLALTGEEHLAIVDVFTGKKLLRIRPPGLPRTAITFLVVDHASFDKSGNLHVEYRNSSGSSSKYIVRSTDIDRARKQ